MNRWIEHISEIREARFYIKSRPLGKVWKMHGIASWLGISGLDTVTVSREDDSQCPLRCLQGIGGKPSGVTNSADVNLS